MANAKQCLIMFTGCCCVVVAAVALLLFVLSVSKHDEDVVRTFTDPTGFRIPVPGGWRLEDHSSSNQLIRADITHSDEVGVQIRLEYCMEDQLAEKISWIVQKYKADMAGHWGGDCVPLDPASSEMSTNVNTHRFCLTRRDGQKWFLQLSFVYGDGKLVIMQAGCLWKNRDPFCQDFDRMLAGTVFFTHS